MRAGLVEAGHGGLVMSDGTLLSDREGKAFTAGTIYLFSLWTLDLGFFRALMISVIIFLCCMYSMGSRWLTRLGVLLLLLGIATSGGLVPPMTSWKPVMISFIPGLLPTVAQATP
jgi:hypothetical protein